MPMTDPGHLPSPRTRRLGRTGVEVSALAWGMWRFRGNDVNAARALVEAALAAGITLFDTADVYGLDNVEPFGAAETLLGRVLAEAPQLRDGMVLATKGGIEVGTPYDSSPGYVGKAIDASLSRLGLDHVELWQIHRPDILAHPQELARTLEDAVRSGKVGAVGVSNFTPAQTAALTHYLKIPLASIQPEFSPLLLEPIENGLLDLAMTLDCAVLAWSPLGQGRIAEPASDRERAVAQELDRVAAAHGVGRTAAAYSWLMAHPSGAIPIVGSQQAARIAEAADALKVQWTRADWYKVLVASRGEPLP
jgi:aryl-alcohol dehydrogenase-like predicted oxidoreductase